MSAKVTGTISEEELRHRQYAIREAIGSQRLEGLIVSDKAKSIMEANMMELISDEEMVSQIKSMHENTSQEEYQKLTQASKDPYLLSNGTMKNKLGIVEAHLLEQVALASADIVYTYHFGGYSISLTRTGSIASLGVGAIAVVKPSTGTYRFKLLAAVGAGLGVDLNVQKEN